VIGAFYNAEGECVAVRIAVLSSRVLSTCAPRKLVVLCLYVSGGVSQGDPDNIEKTYYTWGMQLDTVEWEDEEGVSFCLPVPAHAACSNRSLQMRRATLHGIGFF
jgi:hypothetical protein